MSAQPTPRHDELLREAGERIASLGDGLQQLLGRDGGFLLLVAGAQLCQRTIGAEETGRMLRTLAMLSEAGKGFDLRGN